MKKFSVILLSALIWLVGSCLALLDAHADVEWKVKKQLRLKEKPLAVLASLDGQYIYILVEGRLLIYSLTEGRGKYSIPVDKSLDMITLSEANKLLILASSSEKLIRMVELEFILQLDISDLPYKGPKDAPVTITAFIDYQWEHCARLEPLLQQVLDKYENKVKLVFKNFPLESHGFAFMAATAALAANQQNKFWEYHKKLFENFNSLDGRKLETLAAGLGLDMDKFKLDMQSSSINNVINRDIGDGYMAEVSGIPAVFVNGKRLEDQTLQGFQQVIDFELNKKASTSSDPDKAPQ